MNIITRPVYKKPEMLQLSIEYELAAREIANVGLEYKTIFCIEGGSDPKVIEIAEAYPYQKELVFRPKRISSDYNMMEGMSLAFEQADTYLLHFEDDILIHPTYFKFINKCLTLAPINDFNTISAESTRSIGDMNCMYKDHYYSSHAVLLTKHFWEQYVAPIKDEFYSDPMKIISNLTNTWKPYLGKGYRYPNNDYWQHDGLFGRFMDISWITEGKYTMLPDMPRNRNIGFVGENHPGNVLVGDTFEERLSNLRIMCKDASSLYRICRHKIQNDYKDFDSTLDSWDNNLYLEGSDAL